MTKYLIIGNSAATVSSIEALREIDREGEVTVISEEKYTNYSRPLISYFLGGKIGKNKMSFREKEFYKKYRVNLTLGQKAKKLDIKARTVKVSGKSIHFDRLLLATGGLPIQPSINGADLDGIFTFTRYDDVLNIKQYINKNKVEKVVILGGGLIGLKACEAVLLLNKKVVIVELADRILSTTFDKKASSIMENVLKKHGSEIITQNSIIEAVGEKGRISKVILKNQQKISLSTSILY